MHSRSLRAIGAAFAITVFPVASILSAQEPEFHHALGSLDRGARVKLDVDTLGTRPFVPGLESTLLLGAAIIGDERIRPIALRNRSPLLDRIAVGADVIGTAGHIVPALVLTYAGARVSGKNRLAAATLRVALSYVVADAIEASVKPMVGRARPELGREPLTFRPFSMNGDFQSFPSAHEVHISSLSTAIAVEARRPWVNALAAIAMTYVGAQRVYRDQHWTSDVVASGILGVNVARATEQWLHARGD